MPIKIQDLVAGSEDTLLKTERGNEIITAVNALANMTFLPADAAKLDVGPQGGAVMTFNVERFGGGGTVTTANPFQISIENPTTLRVLPGILRCFYQGSSLLDIIPAPLDPITGGTIALNSWVYLHVVVAQYGSLIAVQSATVISNNTENQQSLYPNFYLKLGGVSGSAAFNYHTTSFQFSVCGFNHEFLTV
jgi:hypothetical protein